MSHAGRRAWHFDAILSVLFAAATAWALWISREQAADAVRQYGHNVDSGALEYAVAVVFLLPVTALFGVAAIAGSRAWPAARCLHWLAVAGAAGPIAYEAVVTVLG